MKNKNLLKFITVTFFLIFIFSIPIITFFNEDKKISEIENKILTQFPRLSLSNIYNKSFMKNFDNYASDQFPFRSSFIKLKNTFHTRGSACSDNNTVEISREATHTASTCSKHHEHHFLNGRIPLFHVPAVQIWSCREKSKKQKKVIKTSGTKKLKSQQVQKEEEKN